MTRSSIVSEFKEKCATLGLKGVDLILSQNGFSIELLIKMSGDHNPIKENPEKVNQIINRLRAEIFGHSGSRSSVRSDRSMIFISINNDDQDRIEEFLENFCVEVKNSFSRTRVLRVA